ncbi:hypothetical protein L873DRAFT_1720788, partial [Choiromyces venosus 120613-1]
SLTQAQAGAQAYTDLSNTKAAEEACSTHQNRSQRSVQMGRVIYAHQARMMLKSRWKRQSGRELEMVKREAIRDRKKKWRPIFKQLKDCIRERNRNARRRVLCG